VLLANWYSGATAPADINDLGPMEWSPNSPASFASATLLGPDELLPEEIEELRGSVNRLLASEVTGAAVVKVHNAYTEAFGAGVADGVIYVVRDPRDVAPSLAAHLGVTLDEAIATLNSPSAALGRGKGKHRRQLPQALSDWSGHVRGWLEECGLPVHVVRYEDLPGAFSGVLRFLGEAPDEERMERAIRHSRLEELQRQEAAHGFKERQSEAAFFRQGKAGAWRRTLGPEQVRQIEAAHGAMMQRFGYLTAHAAGA
jgi:aryl sulfotransferase